MKSYLIIDTIQTITLFALMIRLIIVIYKNRPHAKHAGSLLPIPTLGLLQIFFSSFGVILFENNSYIYIQKIITNTYIAIEMISLIYYYSKYVKKSYLIKILLVLFFSFLFFSGFLINLSKNTIDIRIFFAISESIFFVIICLHVYLEIIFNEEIKDIHKSHFFFFNTGVFALFSTTLPVYLFDAIIQNNLKIYFIQYSVINGISYIFFYLSIIKSINLWTKIQK